MRDQRKTLFISDLHLQEELPEIINQFKQLLDNCHGSVDALYILGDLFEVWIGDDEKTAFQTEIIKALRSATDKGLAIYFLHGNRDFLIGRSFLKQTGCRLLSEEEKITIYGKPLLLMHGDTLCTKDLAYLKARKLAQNRILQTLFLLLPLSIRKKIAAKMRAKSKRHTTSTPYHIMDVTQEEVERIMRKHEVALLIHGHTHRPSFHQFKLDKADATRIVLGAWHERGNMLVIDAAHRKEWLQL